jgi:uncharacterized membrane protein
MKRFLDFVMTSVLAGVLVVVPLYLAVLLLLRVAASLVKFVEPLAAILPDWLPAENMLSLLLVLVLCFVIGVSLRTRTGRRMREHVEKSFFERIPGYALFRSLTQQLAGQGSDEAWMPALIEIEEALVPGFIIEEHDDGQYTVFVPSVPTPLAGAVYVIARDRVHPLDVPFTTAIKAVSRWGSGCKELAAAMKA